MPDLSSAHPGAVYGDQTRARLDALVLNIIRSADVGAAAGLRDLSLGLADAGQGAPERHYWTVCAAFCEALASGQSGLDVANKRLVAQTLRVFMQLARGEVPLWDELLPPLLAVSAKAALGANSVTAASEALASEPLRLLSGGDDADAQDRMRVIGALRVDITAYNLFLNDADELSRQLVLDLTEWTLEPHRAVLDSTIELGIVWQRRPGRSGLLTWLVLPRPWPKSCAMCNRHFPWCLKTRTCSWLRPRRYAACCTSLLRVFSSNPSRTWSRPWRGA
jgi:hypothetical protein